MQDQYSRTQMLLGAEAMTKLHDSRVAVFGVGGVLITSVIQPQVAGVTDRLPLPAIHWLCGVLFVLTLIDLVVTVCGIMHFENSLDNLMAAMLNVQAVFRGHPMRGQQGHAPHHAIVVALTTLLHGGSEQKYATIDYGNYIVIEPNGYKSTRYGTNSSGDFKEHTQTDVGDALFYIG